MTAVHTGSSGARIAGVDAARGLAVVTMVVAHTSPTAIDLPAEYLTAPLFALLIGVSLSLAWKRADSQRADSGGPSAATEFVIVNAGRGLILLVLGELLQRSYAWIDVVLQTLGLLTMTLAPLVVILRARPIPALAAAIGAWVLSPLLMDRSREWRAGAAPDPAGLGAQLLDWLASGEHYRLISHLVFGLAGVALAALLRGRGGGAPRLFGLRGVQVRVVTAAGCAAAALAAYGVGRARGLAQPYAGDHLELLGSTAFASAVVLAGAALADTAPGRRVLAPLIAVGRLALTAYTAQLLLLAGLAAMIGPTWDDDAWWVLAVTMLVCIGGSWLWVTAVRRPGPLEALVRLPTRQ